MTAQDAFTVDQFCLSHQLSRSTFYSLLRTGQGPRTFRIGSRIRISREAAEDWRREREAAS